MKPLVDLIFYFLNYDVTILGYTFSIWDGLVVSVVLGLLIGFLRWLFIGGDGGWK